MMLNKKHITACFTFLELMVVLVITSVIIAIAAPKLGNVYDSVKLDGNARQLKIFLMYARNTALAQHKNCRFFYWADKKEFTLKIQKDPKKYPEIYIPVVGNLSKVKLANGVNLVKAQKMGSRPVPPDTNFSDDIVPMGNKYEFWFTLEGSKGSKINVIVKAGSGIVEIKKE
jgi:type II secretory pathway pseudopilin PulG